MVKSHLFERQVKLAAGVALRHEAETMMRASKELVPVVGGKLKQSGYVDGPHYAGSLVWVDFGYPGVEAAKLHENPRTGRTGGRGPQGQKYPEGSYSKVGQWKFLQTPVNAALPTFPARFTQHMRALLTLRPR